jgi:hypothetical protein
MGLIFMVDIAKSGGVADEFLVFRFGVDNTIDSTGREEVGLGQLLQQIADRQYMFFEKFPNPTTDRLRNAYNEKKMFRRLQLGVYEELSTDYLQPKGILTFDNCMIDSIKIIHTTLGAAEHVTLLTDKASLVTGQRYRLRSID